MYFSWMNIFVAHRTSLDVISKALTMSHRVDGLDLQSVLHRACAFQRSFQRFEELSNVRQRSECWTQQYADDGSEVGNSNQYRECGS